MPLPRPSLTRRVASMLYEILLLLGILSVTFIVPHIAYGLATQSSAHPALVQIHFFAVVLLYFVWFGLNGGQTLAMKTW
ncbi:MAG: hypothetical protein RIR00_1808, partial [Pseudomonadota bacterium]